MPSKGNQRIKIDQNVVECRVYEKMCESLQEGAWKRVLQEEGAWEKVLQEIPSNGNQRNEVGHNNSDGRYSLLYRIFRQEWM